MPIAPRNTATPEGMFEVESQDFQSRTGRGDAILSQEADGQHSFTTSDTLPTQMGPDDRKALERAGVIFGDPVEDDEMFTYVTLPAGWKKVASPENDSRWTELHDDKGRRRAMMFYKAAFYDRSAALRLARRFDYGMDYAAADNQKVIVYYVTDVQKKVFSTEPLPFDVEHSAKYNEARVAASGLVTAWLDEYYPNWQDGSAYWD